ncbi:MAG: metal-sensitive transcriptional regulator [Armatimonadota bacterium]
MDDTEKVQQNIIVRLRRVEGQIRGLQRMIEENQECSDVITQLSAARSALDKVGFIIMSHKMEECIKQKIDSGENADEAFDEAMKLFLKLA